MEQMPFCIQRRVVAHKTMESWINTPHVGIQLDLDVSPVLEFSRQAASMPAYRDVRVTLNSVMLKIIAVAIKHAPEMNAHIVYNRSASVGKVTRFDAVNIAVPQRARDGRMITPVLARADEKSLRDICLGMEDIRRRVANTDVDLLLLEAGLNDTWERLSRLQFFTVLRRLYANFIGPSRLSLPGRGARRAYGQIPESDRITPEDLLSATTLVSNIGSLMPGVPAQFSLLEIIPPQTTAIGLASVCRKPVVCADESGAEHIEIRDILPAVICFDHRAMDFEHIVGFIKELYRLCAPAGLQEIQ